LLNIASTNEGLKKIIFARFASITFRGKYGGNYIDLGHFCGLLSSEFKGTDIDDLATKVVETVKSSVIESGQLGDRLAKATGISIYFPFNSPPNSYYKDLDFAKACVWLDLLEKIHDERKRLGLSF